MWNNKLTEKCVTENKIYGTISSRKRRNEKLLPIFIIFLVNACENISSSGEKLVSGKILVRFLDTSITIVKIWSSGEKLVSSKNSGKISGHINHCCKNLEEKRGEKWETQL